jgi:hypothetical protein
MSNRTQHPDYNDFDAIVRSVRMQRSVAVGDAIAGLLALVLSNLDRAAAVLKSSLSGAKSRTAARGDLRHDVPAHR